MKRWPGGYPQLPVQHCPHCGKTLSAASVLDNGPIPEPSQGDLCVCFGCGEILTFNRRLRLRRITAHELASLQPEELADLRQTQTAIRAFLASEAR